MTSTVWAYRTVKINFWLWGQEEVIKTQSNKSNTSITCYKTHLMFWETFTFVSSSLCQLDVVWVRLKYPNTASAGLLRWGVFISGLGQTGDLGARSSRAGIHNPGLYACSDLCTDIYIHLFCSVAYFHPNCTSAKHLVLQTYYYHIFSLAYSNVLQVILEI